MISEMVTKRSRDEGVVHAVEVASEIGIENACDDEEAEDGQNAVARVRADLLQRHPPDEERRGGECGGGEGDQAGLLRGEGESGGRSEEERPRARLPLRAGVEVPRAGPEHHCQETGEERLLDEVRREEGEEGGRAEQQGEDDTRDEAFREALQCGEAEDEREGGEHERRAAQERAVKRGRVGVSGRPLECGGGVVERGAVMVLRLVRVLARLEETSRGEGLVGLVGVECAVEDHQGRSLW